MPTLATRGVWLASAVLWMALAAKGQVEESKIIGGTITTIDQSPFLAALEERDNASAPYYQVCGSVIIDSRYIISAGHCFADIAKDLTISYPSASLFRIRVGTSILEKGGTLYSVAEYWVHPKIKVSNYTAGTTLDYDISVARLSTPIAFGTTVGKATLIGLGQHLQSGTKVIIAGWGVTKDSNDAPSSVQLRRAIFSVVEQPECDRQYRNRLKETVSQRYFCTHAAPKGTCFGDSGGAVFNRTGSVVAGIVSWGTCVIMPNAVTDLGNAEIRSFIRSKSKLNV